ncbi:MAG: PhzF family phenazine biosynthesis protein [Alphaproteobacteria bacterium]|uniref:PhzF family phenazine biosynthesis protein n=1 Tax=Bradyrhizobium sp. TaxID=376 RepID=UPI001EB177DC|nr:PhzF family phenazine biosynthesis protein [Bradyrhizobium sp.]MBV9570762.1 PhzF family phenazine biosynthesis protein [Alphaproteobacteria bacterium]MBV9979014.1 PhzF family phenazine biosynthesis protein [Bradyrhizobium sp.]
MQLKMWQVDAFASKPLEGNPAAIVPLERFLDDRLMLGIANENNLAETAFLVWKAPGQYDLRWFTPEGEVDLCGHATLASAWLLFEELDPELKQVCFDTRSGTLVVDRSCDGRHTMSLPSDHVVPMEAPADFAAHVGEALGTTPPKDLHRGRYVMGVWENAADVRGIKGPGEIARVLRSVDSWGFIATAPGDEGYDFISRFFAPDKGVPEDPVTGSAHCILVPYWAKRLGKKTLKARQASPRGGDLVCTEEGDRTILAGRCALYMRAEIMV